MTELWFAVMEPYRTRGVPDQLLEALEQFLEKNKLPVLLGTQMLTPSDMNALIQRRKGYVPSRQTFLRMPLRHVNEEGHPVTPPKKVASA